MSKHKVIRLIKQQAVHETICAQPRCKFNGKPAQQGVCYSDKGEIVDWKRTEQQELQVNEELKYFRKKYKRRQYLRWLEAMYVTASLNWTMTLDECIRLRRDIAVAKTRR